MKNLLVLLLAACTPAAAALAAGSEYDREPINYSTATPANAVSDLQQELASGTTTLQYHEELGWLPDLLRKLDVLESSQTLVFSKTSMQRHCIAPWRPRAIYFNDEVYIGYSQDGEVLELSVSDPQLGAVFYSLDQTTESRPEIIRRGDSCLICHESIHNQGFPSHLVRSVYPDRSGQPILSMGSHRVDQTTPLKDRWGGWYVTGTHGSQTHLGNLLLPGKKEPREVDNVDGLNVTDLSRRVATSPYLTPHSDLVALMVLEHQTEMHNRITHLSYQTRFALHQDAVLQNALGQAEGPYYDSTLRRIASAGDDLLEYLLFSGEAPLAARIQGTSEFAKEFVRRGLHDSRGRSLRDLDLEQRIFLHPCSYLIYSDAFDAVPSAGREYVLKRLWEILTGKDTDEKFSHLSKNDRRAILEILQETKPNLPDYWNPGRQGEEKP